MALKLSLSGGLSLTGGGIVGNLLSTAFDLTGSTARIYLTNVNHDGAFTLALSLLDVGGSNILGDVTDATSPELAADTGPLVQSGSNQTTSAATGALDNGDLYLLSYTIADQSSFSAIFPGGTSPFPAQAEALPTDPGTHHRLVTCDSADTGSIIRTTGPGTISEISLRKAEWTVDLSATTPAASAEDAIVAVVTAGDTTSTINTAFPTAGFYRISEQGSDITGTGAENAPFRQFAPVPGLDPGDRVQFGPGIYDTFSLEGKGSGTDGNPIIIEAVPGSEREAIIQGTLDDHIVNGGPGVVAGKASEDGISVIGQSYITVRNLTIRKCARLGVRVTGAGSGTTRSNVTVTGCDISDTGSSAIFLGGELFSIENIGTGETTGLRMQGAVASYNSVTRANSVTDFLPTGGRAEGISAGNGAEDPIIEYNDVFDMQQYGIDLKSGVLNGIVRYNRIWNVERYAIYFDAGIRFVTGCVAHDNLIFNAPGYTYNTRNGLVLAREAGVVTDNVHTAKDNLFYNNYIYNMGRIGIYAQSHPDDQTQFAAGRQGIYEGNKFRFNTVYNADREGSYKDVLLDDFSAYNTATANGGNDFVGNLIYSDVDLDITDGWTGDADFTVDDNFNFADGTPTDPLFVAPGTAVTIGSGRLPTITLPDLSLQAGSSAKDIVTLAGAVDAPFNVGPPPSSNTRVLPADAGAGEVDEVIEAIISLGSFDDATDTLLLNTDTPSSGDWVWGRYANGTTGVTADGSGSFSSTPDEEGTISVGASGAQVEIPETGTTGVEYEIFIYQRVAGVDSNILTFGYTADNTDLAFLSAETADDVTVTVTLTETGVGSTSASDWAFNIDSVPATITNATFTGSAVTLTFSDTLSGGETLDALAYTGTGLEDAHGNSLATFSGQTITNNESAGDYTTGLVEWFDASDAGSITTAVAPNEDQVAVLANLGTNTTELEQLNVSLTPTTGNPASAQNGLNVIDFDGSEYMPDLSPDTFHTSGTIFAAVRIDGGSGGNFDSLFAWNGAADFQFQSNTNPAFTGQINSTQHTNLTRGSAFSNGTFVILAYRFDLGTTSAEIYTDGGTPDDTTSDYSSGYSTAMTAFYMGGSRNSTARAAFGLGEFRRYDGALSDANFNIVGGGMATKWGTIWTDI